MKRSTVVLAVLVACFFGARAQTATIDLAPEVRVPGGLVTLGQLARLHADDLPLVRKLAQLPVGRAPAAGDVLKLEREQLQSWILRHAPDAELRWTGAQTSWIRSRSRKLEGDQIAATASHALSHWVAAQGGRSEVRLAATPRTREAPEGELRLQARPLANAQLRPRMVVWVDVFAGDRFVRTVPVSFKVSAWREAAAARQRLQARDPLVQDALVATAVDVAARGAPVLEPADVEAGQRLRRSLRAGDIVGPRDLAPMPTVARGDWAVLRSGAGAVQSQARVEVLQDGRIGERIRVRQPGAVAAVMARVLAPGQLEVLQ